MVLNTENCFISRTMDTSYNNLLSRISDISESIQEDEYAGALPPILTLSSTPSPAPAPIPQP